MIKIILADYHQIIREGLKMILKEEENIEIVAEAQTEAQVMQRIQNFACDILLLDMDLTAKKGLDLIAEIKQKKPTIKILALSIHPENKATLRLLKAGAAGYLCKDAALDELAIAINKIYTKGRYMSENLIDKLTFEIMPKKNTLPHEQLSGRELETLHKLVAGKRVKDIASELALSMSTVFTYRGRIFEKLEINNNVELMHYAMSNNLIDMNNEYN